MAERPPRLGVIGGSGLYSFLTGTTELDLDTPWGRPSDPITVGQVGDRPIAFLARHGRQHQHPPHRVNYRANLWALREAGVRRVFAPCATGSLRPDIVPGNFVVLDQLIDRTSGRPSTYFDGPGVNHVGFAEPYCPELRAEALQAGRAEGIRVHDGGTIVVISGPRFSTRAESRWHTVMGADVVGMTQAPEAMLARELGLCYTAIALVTDWDAGLEDDPAVRPVSQDDVFRFIADNAERVRALLFRALAGVPEAPQSCGCLAASNQVEPPH